MGASAVREVKHIADLSRAYRRHAHEEFAVSFVWGGSSVAWIQGREVPISGECVVLIAPGIAHACNPDPGSGWNYTQALLDPEACGLGSLLAPCRVLSSSPQMRDAFRSLREAGSSTGLLRLLQSLLPGTGRRADQVPCSHALRRVRDHLRACADAPLVLDELCVVAGLSKYHLVRTFKDAFGLTPHAYHLNLRVNAAKPRLQAGEELATVALETGFCDQSHFTRIFSRCVGVTPAAYRDMTAIPSKNPARR